MRCREALDRLNQLEPDTIEQDKDLQEHLKSCSACARQAEAASDLRQAFMESSVSDETDQFAWSEQIRRVEEAASRAYRIQHREMPVMSALKRQFRLRPRLSVGLAATVVLLLAATLIPLKLDRTVGFEVAVAGVDRDLALNEERLHQFLEQLGVSTAQIDVTGCDTTCRLVVSNLESPGDAEMVAKAFREIGKDHIIVSLNEVKEVVSGSAISHAAHRVFLIERDNHQSTEVRDTVTLRIGGDTCPGAVMYYFSPQGADSDGAGPMQSMRVFLYGDSADSTGALIRADQIVNFHLTEEARADLEAQGYVVEETPNGDGTWTVMLTRKHDGSGSPIKALPNGGNDREAELPDGFALSQNYPNPFNPTTEIEYRIPQSLHVSLEVYNINGQKVRTLIDQIMPIGAHTATWSGTTDSGERVASGVYLYRLTAGEVTTTRKMTLLK